MFKTRSALRHIILGVDHPAWRSEKHFTNSINIDKVLVLSKLSRYEFEKWKFNQLNDREIERELRNRGTDYEKLVECHDLHKRFEEQVAESFKNIGVEVEIVNRFNYSESKVKWANAVFPVGGDGTFLLAASKVKNREQPVIGFNSDPTRSEGHLCLPKKYSSNVAKAIERLQKGQFQWLLRRRIRIKLMNKKGGDIVPKYLHEIDANGKVLSHFKNQESDNNVLPVLALNEVFVGETISSRVSHLQMRLNGLIEQTSIKCSGICICTGTGSTSWHLSINRLPTQGVAELLKLVDVPNESIQSLTERVTDNYNKNLIFKADDNRMCYTIRDLISGSVWPKPKGIKSKEFVTQLEVKSNCFDARLVVDGGVSFDFNDGTIAFFEIREADSLRTVVFD